MPLPQDSEPDEPRLRFVAYLDVVDPWPDGLDELVDMLRAEQGRLLAEQRSDGVIGVFLGSLAVLFILITGDVWMLGIGVLAVTLVAGIYWPLRKRPRDEVLAGLAQRLAVLDPRCPRCGYTLRRLRKKRCPECGQPVQIRYRLTLERAMQRAAGKPLTALMGRSWPRERPTNAANHNSPP
jgi:ribosomal protein L37E